MADVLLSHSYFLRFDPKQWKAQQPYAPLATLYAASTLRNAGCDVSFFDPMFSAQANEVEDHLKKHKPKLFVIYDDGFNYLTKMCLTNMRDAAFEMIAIAKKHGALVAVSSSDSTDHSADYLNRGANFIIVGEGEQTLLELYKAVNENLEVQHIDGLRHMQDKTLVSTKARLNLKDLDQIPFPAWDLVDIESYRQRWIKSSGYFSLNMSTTRGCPFKCNWCAKPIYGNRYNARSPENVVEELKMLKATYQFDHIWFCDDIFGLKPSWVNTFSQLVSKAGLVFKYKIQSRVDLLLEENNINALARSGADEIWVGAESGSQKILDAMDKGTRVEQIVESTQLMKANGIKPCFFLQFGYPVELMEDIQKTLDMVFTLMPHDIGISVSYPLPGTVFYERVKSEMSAKKNWTDSDELLVMFNSSYPADFYKKLQRYVHYEFRKRQASKSLSKLNSISDLKKSITLLYRIPLSLWSASQLKRYA